MQGFVLACGLAAIVWWVVELRLPPLRLALLGTALVLTILVAETPTGVLADLYGRKASVVASYAVMGAAMALMAASPAFASMMAAQALWAAGWDAAERRGDRLGDRRVPGAVRGRCGPAANTRDAARGSAAEARPASGTDPGPAEPAGAALTDTGSVLDQLIVRHATWRSVGTMAGLAVTAAAGTWSLRGRHGPSWGALGVGFACYLAVTMSETGFGRGTARSITAGSAWARGRDHLAPRRRPGAATPDAAGGGRGGGDHRFRRRGLRAARHAAGSSSWGSPTATAARRSCSSARLWFVMAALSIPVMIWLRRRLARPDARRDARLLARLLLVAVCGGDGAGGQPGLRRGARRLDDPGRGGRDHLPAGGGDGEPRGPRRRCGPRSSRSSARRRRWDRSWAASASGSWPSSSRLPVALAVAAGLLGVAAIPVAVVGRATRPVS